MTQVAAPCLVLVADDDEANRDLLGRRLRREGQSVIFARDGAEALLALSGNPVDLVLLDVMMPVMDGLTTLRAIRARAGWTHLPILMISADDDMNNIAACIESGADDYVPKPFHATLLRVRVNALLEKKRLRDSEIAHQKEIERQKSIAQALLRNILPDSVAQELAERGAVDPAYFADATIGFTDFAGFTLSCEKLPAAELVQILNRYFTAFDAIASRYGLEKLKTIGDSYMFAAGLPNASDTHPVDAVLAALEMLEFARTCERDVPVSWPIRIGLHTGPVVAGVVGQSKFAYDVWGNTVNLASRMESSCEPNRINVSVSTFERISNFFVCEQRGSVRVKDGRLWDMYFVESIRGVAAEFEHRYRTQFQTALKAMPPNLAEVIQHA